MTPAEFIAKWSALADEFERWRASVDGAMLLSRVLADFDTTLSADANTALTLCEAANESGYSADHLGRLVRDGKIPNAGRPNAPRILRRHLPRKASALRAADDRFNVLGATPRQIARAVVNSATQEGR